MDSCLTSVNGQQALAVAPLQLKDVVADEILQVHQNDHQRVELISQPEVCELHAVKRCCEDTELETDKRGKRKERNSDFN